MPMPLNIQRAGRYSAIAGALLIVALAVACGSTTVQPGNVGIKIRNLPTPGGPGVGAQPLGQGYHFNLIGEKIVQYPAIQRTYTYTREKDERGPENEEISFSDNNALPMTADVQLVVQVRPSAAPGLYTRYKLSFDQLLDGPLRNDVRTAIAAETEKVTVEQLYKGGRQAVIASALSRVRQKWEPLGVSVSQLDWIGTIRYPDVILNAIQAKTKADADAASAQARVAVAEANSQAQIAEARGIAESTRLRGEALRANPQVIQEIYAKRSSGFCYPENHTCISGQGVAQVWNPAADTK